MSRAKKKNRSHQPSQQQPAPAVVTATTRPAPRSPWIVIAAAVSLAVLAISLFASLRTADFIRLDDPGYVQTNPNVNGGLTRSSIAWAWTAAGYASNWHPLTWMSHMLDVELFGLWAGGHHLTNVVLHALNTLLLFALLYRTTAHIGRSFFVAALFAAHPMHVESVAWISERKDVLSTLFWFLTMLVYVSWTCRPALWRYLLLCLTFTAGLLSKPMLVTLPCVLLLFDLWPLGRWSGGLRGMLPRVIEKLPLFALAAASSIVTVLVQDRGGAMTGLDLLPLGTRVTNALIAYARYLGKLVWPTDMAVFYPYREDLPVWWAIASFALLAAITFVAYRVRRTRPYLTTGWFWFAGTLVPVIGIIQVGTQAIADRYTYVPYIGLFIAVAWAATESVARLRWHAWVAGAAAAGIIGVCSILTVFQVRTWQSNSTVWRHAAAVTTGNYVALNEIGMLLAAEDRHNEALEYFLESARHKPEYAEVKNNLGLTYVRLGRLPEAFAQYQLALRLKPAFPEAEKNYGFALMSVGRYAEAETHFRRAILLRPGFVEAYNNLGLLLASQARVDEAIDTLREAVRLNPGNTQSQFLLAMAYGARNRYDEAAAVLRQVLQQDPTHAGARDVLLKLERMKRGK